MMPKKHQRGTLYWRLQWGDRPFYGWLQQIGLTPAKSLTLGALSIPDQYFADFFRGCIDGDGSIHAYTDRSHTSKNPKYVYERLYVSLVSASPMFLDWIRGSVRRLIGINGSTHIKSRGRNPVYCLR